MAYTRKNLRIGDILLNNGIITDEQLTQALSEQKSKKIKIGEALISLGFVTQDMINDILCEQLDIEYVDLRKIDIDENTMHMVNEDIIRKYLVVPFGLDNKQANVIKVAMENPMDIMAMDDISIITGMNVMPYLANANDISATIDKYYGQSQAIAVAEQFKQEQASYAVDDSEENARKEDIENSPIVQLVKGIIEQAVRQRASDIHIEPFEYMVKIRYRVDGVMRESIKYDRSLYSAIIARLKVISGMDISEKRKPQDGRITIVVDRKEYDIRVSNLPTVFGEKVVMRLASKEGFKRDKKDLGLTAEDMVKFEGILKNPHGIILVTGPTGSGIHVTVHNTICNRGSSSNHINAVF